jgi:DNA-nicking Smr family endonuclease
MARKRKEPKVPRGAGADKALSEKFHAPFRDLDKRIRGARRQRAAQPPPAADRVKERAEDPTPLDDATLFRDAMAGVAPLEPARRRRTAIRGSAAAPIPARIDEESEAYAKLAGIVAGHVPFDIADTGEYVERRVAGFDSRVMRKLKTGELSIRAEVDLHGMTGQEARVALERFIAGSRASGFSCVRVIHGRGLHSADSEPVVKNAAVAWLSGRLGRSILAFSSARPVDGGTGALYVLLKKRAQP